MEALDLARGRTIVKKKRNTSTPGDCKTATLPSAAADTATAVKNNEDTRMDLLSYQVTQELRNLPLRVIELPGRGRLRTGPREQWDKKKVRHHPCAPKQKNSRTSRSAHYAVREALGETTKAKTRKDKCQRRCTKLCDLSRVTFLRLQEEREASRAAFNEFVTTLHSSAGKRQPQRRSKVVQAATTTTAGVTDSSTNSEQKQRRVERRFCVRNARRGKAFGSTRPCRVVDVSKLEHLERMNLGAPSEALSLFEELEFASYTVDSCGTRQRLTRVYTAGSDATVRLSSRAAEPRTSAAAPALLGAEVSSWVSVEVKQNRWQVVFF